MAGADDCGLIVYWSSVAAEVVRAIVTIDSTAWLGLQVVLSWCSATVFSVVCKWSDVSW